MPISIALPKDCIWVTIEGVDKVGKTTLCSRLVAALPGKLAGFSVVGMSEITDSPTGSAIVAAFDSGHFRLANRQFDSQLGDALLWFADQYNALNIARAALRGPTVLVSDRGPDSRRILQELKLGQLTTLEELSDVLAWIQAILCFLPTPDITLVLSASTEVTQSRMNARPEYEEYMRAAKRKFDLLPLQQPTRSVLIDGDENLDEVFKLSFKVLTQRLEQIFADRNLQAQVPRASQGATERE